MKPEIKIAYALAWAFMALALAYRLSHAEGFLTVGQNHNFMLGSGTSVGLDVTQPLAGPLSLRPYGFWDVNDGFHDRSGGMDLVWAASPRLTFSMGAEYEKYELMGVEPTETSNVHTAMRVKLW